MKASELLVRIEKAGGKFEIKGRCVYPLDIPGKYQAALARQGYLVSCLVLERQAAQRWEASGRDPKWWRGPQLVVRPRDAFEALKQLLAAERVH